MWHHKKRISKEKMIKTISIFSIKKVIKIFNQHGEWKIRNKKLHEQSYTPYVYIYIPITKRSRIRCLGYVERGDERTFLGIVYS